MLFLKNFIKTKKFFLYTWQGINSNGEYSQGQIFAEGCNAVKQQLLEKGIVTRKIIKKKVSRIHSKIKIYEQLAELSQQMAWTFESGIPLLQGIHSLLNNQFLSTQFMHALLSIQSHIERGLSITQAFQQHPKIFDYSYCQQLKTGETTGQLPAIFKQLAKLNFQKARELRQFKQLLIYPILTLCLSLLIFLFFLIYIIPAFAQLYQTMNAPIPSVTQNFIHLSNIINKNIGYIIFYLITLYLIFTKISCHHKLSIWKQRWHQWKYKIPYIGKCFQAIMQKKLASHLLLTLTSGLSILQAIQVLKLENPYHPLTRQIPQITFYLHEGQTLKKALENTQLFHCTFLQLIQIGEQTGMLEATLEHLVQLNTMQIENTLQQLKQYLEPCLMAFLSLIIGGLLIICYLPIFQLGDMI